MQIRLEKREVKFRGSGSGKERRGSLKFGIISDDFGTWIVRWSRGEWKIEGTRWNSKVTTSLQTRAMTIAIENGREVKEVERYTDFMQFAERLARIVGVDEALNIVQWIRS